MIARLYLNLPCRCLIRRHPGECPQLKYSILLADSVCWSLRHGIRAQTDCALSANTPLTSDTVGKSIFPKTTRLVPTAQRVSSNACAQSETLNYRETGVTCAFRV